jgi:hypothetical protein
VTVELRVEHFTGSWAALNGSGGLVPVNTADVVRAAVTVGGPVQGGLWHRSMRRASIAGTVLAAVSGSRRAAPVGTTTLYRRLERTEKGGVSFRLGMAFASLAAEQTLKVRLLEHLNRANSTLAPGSARRADLFGMDRYGAWHVVEAKSRTHGVTREDVSNAKQQALNVTAVSKGGAQIRPATKSASLVDLALTPVRVRLIDPAGEAEAPSTYEVDVERFIATHYSVVPDLLELRGGPQPPPDGAVDDSVVGAYFPGTDIWIGVHASLIGESAESWVDRVNRVQPAAQNEEQTSAGPDGHVLRIGSDLRRMFDWADAHELDERDRA